MVGGGLRSVRSLYQRARSDTAGSSERCWVVLGGRGGKTPIAGALGRGVHRASTGKLDGISQLHQQRA
jgi:hypothetical protein